MTESFAGSKPARELERVIARVRRRWRARRMLNGAAIAVAVGLVAVLGVCFALDLLRFEEGAVSAARIVLALALITLFGLLVLPPLLRRAPAARVALYLEEREPTLGAAVLSAVDTSGENVRSEAMQARLVGRALAAARSVEQGRRADGRALKRAWIGALAAGAAVALVALQPPGFVRNGFAFLFAPWRTEAPVAPYVMYVEPGGVTVARGADLAVTAVLEGFSADTAVLATRVPGTDSWTRRAMRSAASGERPGARHEAELLALDTSLEYQVLAGGVSSEVFAVEVVALPEVSRIDLRYEFPAHTGLAPAEVEDGGDIEALAGTTVTVLVETTAPAALAQLVIVDAAPMPLEAQADGRLVTSFELERDGRYHIALAPVGGERLGAKGARASPASPEYLIRALEDRPPVVRVEWPGRDIKVTSIEEPHIQVTASDDFGLGGVDLLMSINGGPEQRIALDASRRPDPAVGAADAVPGTHPPSGDVQTIAAAHTVYLEDFDLSPGDLVSYHVRAKDRAGAQAEAERDAGAVARDAVTDLYFMEVRPFARNYRESQGGGGGQGGQQQDEGSLSNRQREVVVAIFKLVQRAARSEASPPDATFSTDLSTVSSAESRILTRVEAIIRRLGEREQVREDESYRTVANELPLAQAAIAATVDALEEADVVKALPHAQTAMRHLQRADAASRDVQVSMAGQGGGGGQGEGSDDLTRLLRLELDKLRNTYEDVQRAAPPSEGQMTDELLERLRELAQRQQKELERARLRERGRRQGNSGGDQAGGGSASSDQEALAQEAEELARRLERLSRHQPDPALSDSLERLRDAAESMRQAARAGRESGPRPGQGSQQSSNQSGARPGGQQSGQSGEQSAGQGGGSQGGASGQTAGRGQSGEQPSEVQQSQADRSDPGTEDADALELTRMATQRIREARDALVRAQAAAERRGLQDARRRTQALAERQRGVEAQIGALPEDYFERERAIASIQEAKRQMESQARALENDIAQLTKEARESGSAAAEAIERARDSAESANLPGRIASSRERLRRESGPEGAAAARAREARIARAVDEIDRRLAQAAGEGGEEDSAGIGGTLDRMGDLIRDLESMRARLEREAKDVAAGGGEAREIARIGSESGETAGGEQARSARQSGESQGQQRAAGEARSQGRDQQPGGQQSGEAGPGGGPSAGDGDGRLTGGRTYTEREGAGPGDERAVRQGGRIGRYAYGADVEAKDRVDWRGMRGEAAARVGDAERLRQALASGGADPGDVEALLAELAALEGAMVNGAASDRLAALSAQALERLRALDFELRERLEDQSGQRRYATAAPDRLPPDLRTLVERYYRSLAQ